MTEDMVERDLAPVVAQLRQAYALLVNGHVGDHKRFADGLIAPQIRRLERLTRGVLSSPSEGGRWVSEPFQFLPGEKLKHVVGAPGPDLDDCEVVSQDGEMVTIRYQVWGTGPVYTDTVHPLILVTDKVEPSAGFVLDDAKMPMCEPCQVPAGLRRRELARLAS